MDLREIPGDSFTRHPWEAARASFFAGLVLDQGLASGAAPLQVLDVGAGDGYLAGQLLRRLPAGSEVTCFDPFYTDQQLARPAPAGLRFTRQRPERRFDLALLLDVVEHVPDDRAFLEEIVSQALATGGAALISVPAWMALYCQHDRALGHHRRYRPAQLRSLVTAVGLTPVAQGGLFHSLLAPRTATKVRELARGVRSRPDPAGPAVFADTELGRWRAGKALTAAVAAALRIDNGISRLAARVRLPLPGLSVWALGRRA
jgi:SAM-dependent methyltransferase